MPPCVKFFMWRLFHGNTPTFAYSYNLNFGPRWPCPLWGPQDETVEHLIRHCSKSNQVWLAINACAHINLRVIEDFSNVIG